MATANIYDMVDTWNDGATTFTAIKMNVTDTASDADSLLMDLQVGGASRFSVSKGGNVKISGNLIDGPSFWDLGRAGSRVARVQGSGIVINGSLRLGAGLNDGNTIVTYDANNTLAQRNSTNAQTFNLYNTYTDASNYERGFMKWNSNVLEIGTEAAGTGTARAVGLKSATQDIVLGESATEIRSRISGTSFPSWVFQRGTSNVRCGIAINNSTADFGSFSNYPVGIRVNNQEKVRVTVAGTLGLSVGNTVSSLPGTPTEGMMARVTDGDSGLTFGNTVVNSGAGATSYLVWYNGSNWTVIGV